MRCSPTRSCASTPSRPCAPAGCDGGSAPSSTTRGCAPTRPSTRPPGSTTTSPTDSTPCSPVWPGRDGGGGGSVELRDATTADLPAILALSNVLIETTTVAWTSRLETFDERTAWFDERRGRGDAVLVADVDGDVVGFCSWG